MTTKLVLAQTSGTAVHERTKKDSLLFHTVEIYPGKKNEQMCKNMSIKIPVFCDYPEDGGVNSSENIVLMCQYTRPYNP
jgi:hypothetical protein